MYTPYAAVALSQRIDHPSVRDVLRLAHAAQLVTGAGSVFGRCGGQISSRAATLTSLIVTFDPL